MIALTRDGGVGWTLREFWERFYSPTVLERFDLQTVWELVQQDGNQPLSEGLSALLEGRDHIDPERLSRVVQSALSCNDASDDERSLLAANILSLIVQGQKVGKPALLSSLEGFLLGNQRALGRRPYPTKYLVELTNSCNLNCVMCGVGAKGYDPSRTMPLPFFERLCHEELSTAKVIRLNGLGESTIIPDFVKYLDAAEHLPAELEIVTNLSTTSDVLLQRLVALDPVLFVSCDAVVLEDLARIRRGLDVGRFVDNLRSLECLSAERGRDPLRTQIIMTILSSNFRQLPAMVQFAAQHRVGGVIANMQKGDTHWMRREFSQLVETFRLAEQVAARGGVQLMVPDQVEGVRVELGFSATSNAEVCPTYREEAFVRYNGDVCPCNMMNPFVYGNLRRRRMEEVLRSLPTLLFDYLMEVGSRHPYCRNCYYLRRR